MKLSLLILGLFAIILLSGCVAFQDENGNRLALGKDSEGYFLTKLESRSYLNAVSEFTLRAMVKGSIYESGEGVSVFGTCLTADDEPISNVTAYFSSWYPNGTKLHTNVTMMEFQPSYYLFNGTMNSVQGTYLTELTCLYNPTGQVARAFGEWQNPFWVRRIALLNDTVSESNELLQNLTVDVANVSIQIGNLTILVNDSFEIVFDQLDNINQTIIVEHNVTNTLIREGFNITNVNNSLIIELLQNLTGIVTPANLTGTLANWTEDTDDLVFWTDWDIEVKTFNPFSFVKVGENDVQCFINTTLTPLTAMTPRGVNFWDYTEFINVRGNFDWTVNCFFL